MMLVVVVGTVVGANMLGRTAQVSDQLLQRIQPAQTEAYRLQAALVNQETGVRGYAGAADRQFLEPYTRGKREETEAAARLRALVVDRPALLADLEAVEQSAADWRSDYAEPLVASVVPGRPRPVDQRTADRGKESFDHLRALWTNQNADLARAVREGRAKLSHEREVRNLVLSGMVAVFLLTGLALAVLVRMLVTRPLEALRRASRLVADGDFGHVISADGPTDLAAVAADVEGMRQRIVAELEASRRQRDALTQQAADLDAQAVELRRSNAELEQFAYVASHDLQEPLRKVASFCQLLEKRYGDKLDDRGLQYIDFAVDGAKRMQILINDLLTFSRVGRVNDAQLPVALDQTLDKALTNLAAAVEESGARVDRPEHLPEVVGDPTLLAMLWQNLAGNALKFRHPDRAPHVVITCEPDPETPDDWRLSVGDNGIGIPAQFAEKVFVIFQRLHGRDAYGGTGIGLALCKKIVEYHGGRIWLDTDHTEGTRFCFTLPSATATASPTDAPRTAPTTAAADAHTDKKA
ncbi:sensor histidine kinase [Streptomyces rishiriensis]|uniref:sensor histidine kinase n=1 Tax=Streptomyces rishiriensis TaxID=68264 RepID=UPI000D5A15F2|nr:CHASE3 domain-containing protein [Streptomyces rishiriensis]